MPGRARRLGARAALEEDQERPVEPVGIGDLAREDGDPLAVRAVVVERHRELVLGQHEAGGADGFGHRRRLSLFGAGGRVAAMALAEEHHVEVLRQAKVDLAAALRAAALYGYNEGIDNHFSYAVPGSDDRFLLNPFGPDWSELPAADLIMVDGEGNVVDGDGEWEITAFMIHRGAHRPARPPAASSTPTCPMPPRCRRRRAASTRRSARPR